MLCLPSIPNVLMSLNPSAIKFTTFTKCANIHSDNLRKLYISACTYTFYHSFRPTIHTFVSPFLISKACVTTSEKNPVYSFGIRGTPRFKSNLRIPGNNTESKQKYILTNLHLTHCPKSITVVKNISLKSLLNLQKRNITGWFALFALPNRLLIAVTNLLFFSF